MRTARGNGRGGVHEPRGAPAVLDFRSEAFGDLDLVYTVARLVAGAGTAVERVLPAVMVAAYRRWPERPADQRPRAWLMGLLMKELDVRHGEAIPAVPHERARTAYPTQYGLAPLVIRRAIMEMRGDEREVIALCDVATLSYDEAAEVLAISRAEVKERLYSARAALYRRLFGSGHLRADR